MFFIKIKREWNKKNYEKHFIYLFIIIIIIIIFVKLIYLHDPLIYFISSRPYIHPFSGIPPYESAAWAVTLQWPDRT